MIEWKAESTGASASAVLVFTVVIRVCHLIALNLFGGLDLHALTKSDSIASIPRDNLQNEEPIRRYPARTDFAPTLNRPVGVVACKGQKRLWRKGPNVLQKRIYLPALWGSYHLFVAGLLVGGVKGGLRILSAQSRNVLFWEGRSAERRPPFPLYSLSRTVLAVKGSLRRAISARP